MILNRTWNKKEQKLVVSYIDKLGNRQFYQNLSITLRLMNMIRMGNLKHGMENVVVKFIKTQQTILQQSLIC